MKRIFIWLDDERKISEKWTIIAEDNIDFILFRTGEDLIDWYKVIGNKYDKIFISLDHDLGNGLSGYDVAKYIVEHQLLLTGFTVHSMNPVGVKNIIDLLTHYGYYKLVSTNEINTL